MEIISYKVQREAIDMKISKRRVNQIWREYQEKGEIQIGSEETWEDDRENRGMNVFHHA